eukprot:5777269-Pleurochrysis_carterae.AAC.1
MTTATQRCEDSSVDAPRAASDRDSVQTATTTALRRPRQRNCEDSGAGAVKTATTAALCRQPCRRCGNSDAGSVVRPAAAAPFRQRR